MFPQPEAEQSNEYIKSVGKPGNLHKKKSQIHRLCWQIFASFTTHDSDTWFFFQLIHALIYR